MNDASFFYSIYLSLLDSPLSLSTFYASTISDSNELLLLLIMNL